MRKSIILKITGLFFLMLVVAVANVVTIYFHQAQHRHDAHVVNVAGRQRMLTQKISKLAFLVASGEDADRKPLGKSIVLYSDSLESLRRGCEIMDTKIPTAPKAMEMLFKNNESLWVPFKGSAETVAKEIRENPSFKIAIDYIKLNNEDLLEASDRITLAFDEIYNKKMLFLRGLLFAMLAIDIVFFAIGYLVAIRIVRPLKTLSEVAAKVGSGDFTARAPIASKDEVGELAISFNKMAADLNISLQKEKEFAAKAAAAEVEKRRAEELGQLKTQFVSNVSHEFRNPLATIRESINIVLDGSTGDMNPQQKKFLTSGKINTERLIRLVTNLLDVSRIESGKVKMRREKIDVAALVDDVLTSQEGEISKKELVINKDIEQDIGILWGDRDMLTEVLINILSNSIKYNKNGGDIGIKIRGTDKEVKFEISDNGPGISKSYYEKIFDKFVRITAEKKEGTGLGLPIAKDIISLHKGRIWVDSEIGKGSKFTFILPREPGRRPR